MSRMTYIIKHNSHNTHNTHTDITHTHTPTKRNKMRQDRTRQETVTWVLTALSSGQQINNMVLDRHDLDHLVVGLLYLGHLDLDHPNVGHFALDCLFLDITSCLVRRPLSFYPP